MKPRKALRSAVILLALTLFLCGSVSAAGSQTVEDQGAGEVTVNVTANPPVFNVTLPTRFSVAIGENGQTVTAPVEITNGSAVGSIAVSSIEVQSNGGWTLTGFRDLSREAEDSKQIGFSLTPVGGRSAAEGTALVTTDGGGATEQVLLARRTEDWVIDAANDGDTDVLTIVYDARVSPVSETVNEQAASIIITVGWNTAE